MRATRYIWITNLPSSFTEDELRGVFNSYGKIQSVKLLDEGAVVAFTETRSATKAVESSIKLRKNSLKMQYCESPEALCVESSQLRSDQRSDSLSDSKSIAGEIDTDSTSSSPYSSHSSSPRATYLKKGRDHRKSHGGSQDRPPKCDSRGSRRQDGLRGLKITQLPLRSSDTNLREGLFHEYKKHGKITSLAIKGTGSSRFAHITFKLSEDAEKAFEHSKGKVFFGVSVRAELVDGLDIEDPDLCPPEHAMDEYHPKATKTLFVGNLCSATVTQVELQRVFQTYGDIIEIDIKTQTNQPGTSYAFVQYTDIKSVVRALSDQESITISGKSVKLGFGKSQPSNVVWLDNLSPSVTETFLMRQFGRYGRLKDIVVDSKLNRALLYFDTVEAAQRALNETRNRSLLGRKVQIDYATLECQVAFMEKFGTINNFYGKYRDKLREIVEAYMPCGGLMSYLEENRGSQGGFNRRTKDLGALIGLSDASRSSKYGYNRSSHHSSSRNGSPVRGSIYSRSSPQRDYNGLSGSSFRGSGGLLSSLGLSNYKHHSSAGDSPRASSNRDRARYSRCRKSVAPASLDCSRMSNGGTSYQHSMGYSNGDISPQRQQSWSNNKKSHYAASTCSDSSVERKQDKREPKQYKQGLEHQRSSSKHKSSHRTSLERHRHKDDPSPIQGGSGRRHLRDSAVSTPDLAQVSKSSEGTSGGHNVTKHTGKGKAVDVSRSLGQQHKTSVISNCSSNGEALTKLQRERMELLMKLTMLQTKYKAETIAPSSSNQPKQNGVDINLNGSVSVPDSQPNRITSTVGCDFVASGSSGSAGRSSSSDPGDVLFSPNIIPRPSLDRLSSSQVPPPPPPPPLPPPPPPPPPLPLRLSSSTVVPSPALPISSPRPSSFESIASPPPWDTQSTTIESDLPLLATRIHSPSSCSNQRFVPNSALTFTSKAEESRLPSSPKIATATSQKLSLDSDSEQAVDALDSSLDERIRRLDAKIQHSAKIRLTVGYSKFRIRRKSDLITSTTTGASSSLQASMPLSTSVVSTDITVSPLRLFASPTSPDVVSSTTSPGVRPTDISEFVKSMLSSNRPSSSKITAVDSIVPPASNSTTSRLSHPHPPPLSPLTALSNRLPILDRPALLSPITRSPIHTPSPTCGGGGNRRPDHLSDLKQQQPSTNTNSRSSTALHNTPEVTSTLSPSTTTTGSCLVRSPGKGTAKALLSPGIKPILKKESLVTSTVSSTPKMALRPREGQNDIHMKELFPPQPAQTMQIMKRKSQQPVSPAVLEKDPGFPSLSPSLSKPLQNGPTGRKRRSSTSSVTHTSPKSPKTTTPLKAKSLEDEKSADPLPRPGPEKKQVEAITSPKTKKAHGFTTPPMKLSRKPLASPSTTPFERNKLHFKKLPKLKDAPHRNKSPLSALTSNTLPKCTKSSNGPESRGVTSKSDPGTRKKRLKRKRQESDEEDWKPQGAIDSMKVEDIVTEGVLYETMYDKIKRRGNKDTLNERPEAKPEALKSLLKSRKHKINVGIKSIDPTPYDSDKNSDVNETQSEHISKRATKKPPHLTPQSAEPLHTPKSHKKSRLKRPESEGGSSSESDNRLSAQVSTNRRRKVLSVSRKRRISGDTRPKALPGKPKKAAAKRRVARKLVTLFSSNSSESDSDSFHSARGLPRAFFPERGPRRPASSRSSSTSSTPQISRSCSPAAAHGTNLTNFNNSNGDENGDHEEATADALPLLEKQISSDVENEEGDVALDMEAFLSPPPALPVTAELRPQSEALVKREEGVGIKEEELASPGEYIVLKPPRSSAGGLILTSPLVKQVTATKAEELGNLEESGLVLLSSAAEAEAIKQESEELQNPSPLPPQTPTQPLTLLTPVSVIPAASANQQHITLLVNTISNAQSGSRDSPSISTSPTTKTQSTFVLAPTFSLVAPVAIPADPNQLIINRPPLIHPAPDAPTQNNLPTTNPSSSNMTEFVQHIIEQVAHQKKEESSQGQEKARRVKKPAQQKTFQLGAGTGVGMTAASTAIRSNAVPLQKSQIGSTSVLPPPLTPVQAPADPYEPNFDETEVVETMHPAGKDTVSEVINSVVHGEFEQKEYVHRLANGTRISPACQNSIVVTANEVVLAPARPASSSEPQISPLAIQEQVTVSQQPTNAVPTSLCSTPSPSTSSGVTSMTSLTDDRRLLSRPIQPPSTVAVPSPEPTPSLPSMQHQPPQQLMESSPLNEQSSIPANILSPLQVLTFITPNSKSSEAVAQQISPQTQPQLQEFAACLAKNYFSLLSHAPPPQAFVDTVDSGSKNSPNPVQQTPHHPPPSSGTPQKTAELYAAATMAAMAAMSPSPSEAAAAAVAVAAAAPSAKQNSTPFSHQSQLSTNFWWLDPRFLEDKLSLVWRGCMSLKNERVSVRMLYLAGNQDLIRTCLQLMTATGDDSGGMSGTLRIAQRMRLENSQLEAVQWKLREPANYCMCLALASGSPPLSPASAPMTHRNYMEDAYFAQQNLVLQNVITYLQDKTAAGIISCPSSQENPFVMHIFPPCDFTIAQLRCLSPELQQTLVQTSVPFMLIVVV